ncbi:MAG: Fic family protein [Sphingomonadaceae bacterium]|nr:Fic family protein [Sphingomonadaceae bacterium]
MDKNGFDTSCSGTLIPTLGARKAFLPDKLPPQGVDLNSILPILSRATQAVGELKGIGRTIPNPLLLIRPLQRREAVSSSGMEGTYTTLSDLLMYEAGASIPDRQAENREVLNYVRALETAIADLGDLPISARLIKRAHKVLLDNVARHRGAKIEAGEFKRDQNWIGGTGTIETARFIPAPPEQTPQAIDDLAAFINRTNRENSSPLIDAAYVHYQFEAIHPFGDGNGRVGRMLIAVMLIENETLPQPLLYMSPWLEKNKDLYIDLMFDVSKNGNWVPWVEFFLTAVAESAEETIRVAQKIQDLQRDYRERFQTARRSALMLRIIDLAFERPVRTVSDIADELGVTYAGASNNIKELVRHGVAEEINWAYPKLIRFPGVMEAMKIE